MRQTMSIGFAVVALVTAGTLALAAPAPSETTTPSRIEVEGFEPRC